MRQYSWLSFCPFLLVIEHPCDIGTYIIDHNQRRGAGLITNRPCLKNTLQTSRFSLKTYSEPRTFMKQQITVTLDPSQKYI